MKRIDALNKNFVCVLQISMQIDLKIEAPHIGARIFQVLVEWVKTLSCIHQANWCHFDSFSCLSWGGD